MYTVRHALNVSGSSKSAIGENMEPSFMWWPYTMLFASEKSAAFSADRKMAPNDTAQFVSP